jgi:hypothetical protein
MKANKDKNGAAIGLSAQTVSLDSSQFPSGLKALIHKAFLFPLAQNVLLSS